MPEPIKLRSPLVRVIRASEPDKELMIQTANPDLLLWDKTRAKHKWPKFDDAPTKWLTFISWAGARRNGLIGLDVTYEAWEADVLEALPPEDEKKDEDDDESAPFPDGVAGSARDRDSASD
jgi:hypothetical protein